MAERTTISRKCPKLARRVCAPRPNRCPSVAHLLLPEPRFGRFGPSFCQVRQGLTEIDPTVAPCFSNVCPKPKVDPTRPIWVEVGFRPFELSAARATDIAVGVGLGRANRFGRCPRSLRARSRGPFACVFFGAGCRVRLSRNRGTTRRNDVGTFGLGSTPDPPQVHPRAAPDLFQTDPTPDRSTRPYRVRRPHGLRRRGHELRRAHVRRQEPWVSVAAGLPGLPPGLLAVS